MTLFEKLMLKLVTIAIGLYVEHEARNYKPEDRELIHSSFDVVLREVQEAIK